MLRRAVLAAWFACGAVVPARGAAQFFEQADSTAHRLLATRPVLTALAQTLDSIEASPTASGADHGRARVLAHDIHARLAAGDFQAGDRVIVRVVGEVGLPETLAVSIDGDVELPTVGTIPLTGVLRSEVGDQIGRAVGRVIRDPEVHAHGLVRFSVQGEVAHPGYCNVPADATLSDVITASGGLTKDAKMTDLRIERGGLPVLQKDALRQMIEAGLTVDQAGLRPGDEFLVPSQGGTNAGDALRLAAVILSIPITVYTLLKLF